MEDFFARYFGDLIGRVDGPMSFRFLLQPILAILFALRDGRRDAREGSVPYFWALFSQPIHRRDLLKDGWHGIYRLFTVALVLDVIYQLLVFHHIRPLQGLIVATVLALVPYMLLRGPANRLMTRAARSGWKGLRP
jgi:hypothetical protein